MKKIIILFSLALFSCCLHPKSDVNDYKGCVVIDSKSYGNENESGVTKIIRTHAGTIKSINLPEEYGSLFLKGDTIK